MADILDGLGQRETAVQTSRNGDATLCLQRAEHALAAWHGESGDATAVTATVTTTAAATAGTASDYQAQERPGIACFAFARCK
jgi:hypothetical protein